MPAMATASSRLRSIDTLRGLIMVVMALDHVGLMVGRFHSQEMWAGAWTRYSSALPFLTRFVTHFCAPGFFLLMGAGTALMADARSRQGWSDGRIARSIVTRGLLLVAVATLLEVPAFLMATLSGPSLGNNPEFAIPGTPERRWVLTVLFALGTSMAANGLLIRARSAVWALLASAALLLTAATTPGPDQVDTAYGFARSVLMLSRWSHGFWSQYPIVPWFGIAALGVLLGRRFIRDTAGTFRVLPWLGFAALAMAVGLRVAGGFGNIRAPRDHSWIEFLNLIKYPPSLVFTLFMVGGNLVLLALIERASFATTVVGRIFETFGRAPLAFYIAHLWLFAIIGMAWFRQGTGYGVVYAIWLAGLVPLYFLTRSYAAFSAATPVDSRWRYF
jgi:uncharacterized membrane protein